MHRIAALRWRLYDRAVDLKPLRVLAEERFDWGAADVRVCVLGASHAVAVTVAGRTVTELLTCVAPPDAPVESVDWVRVEARRQRVPLDTRPRGDHRLTTHFPEPEGARTEIAWRIDGARLTVETVHAYPEEARALWSRTVFEAAWSG